MQNLKTLIQHIKTQWVDTPRVENIKNWAYIGLIGEVGEIASCLKDHLYRHQEFNKDNFIEECGDTLHYFLALLAVYGITIEEVAENNINKLNKRFPNGYNTQDALLKRDKEIK